MDKSFTIFYGMTTPDQAKCLACDHCKCTTNVGWNASFKCTCPGSRCWFKENTVSKDRKPIIIFDAKGDMTPEDLTATYNYRLKTGGM